MSADAIQLAVAAAALLVIVALLVVWRRRSARPGPVEPVSRASLRDRLAATRDRLAGRLDAVFGSGRELDVVLDEVEEALVGADVGVRTAGRLVERMRADLPRGADGSAVRAALRAEMRAILARRQAIAPAAKPCVILVTGVNGVGKTTTVAKLAARHRARGERVLLVAADTYRAAAAEQLDRWRERLDVEMIRGGSDASPAAVAFDGITAAVARDVDVVLVDTAGRLHTRTPLMDELRKVRRVIGQVCPGAPHQTLLVLDATTGQNALVQARTFMEAVQVDAVILTKLDGTARGGIAVAVAEELGLPIAFIGVGEAPEDLRAFDAEEFTAALLGDDRGV